MKIVTTTEARKGIGKIVDAVRMTGRPVAIGRRNIPEVLIIRYPRYNPEFSEITNLNAVGGAFDFLAEEPDLYSDKDLKERYA